MKFILTHHHHDPSPSFIALVKQRIDSLSEALQIDEAHVLLERRLEASPVFRIGAHLVTPGPDVCAIAVDHTLRAALDKMIVQLEARIDHRHQKRARREQKSLKKTSLSRTAPVRARN